jgi:enoyl-CoA hydratase/carnithine racemase
MQVFAMPETFLGHFPDVGASYFLSRLPGFYGSLIPPFFIELKYMWLCLCLAFHIPIFS